MVTVMESQPLPMPDVAERENVYRWRRHVRGTQFSLRTHEGTVTYAGVARLGAERVEVTVGWSAERGRPVATDITARGIGGGATMAQWFRSFPAAEVEWDAIMWLTRATERGSSVLWGPITLSRLGFVPNLQRGSGEARPQVDARQLALDYLGVTEHRPDGRGVFPGLAAMWDCSEVTARKRVQRLSDAGWLEPARGDRRAVRGPGRLLSE